MILCEFYPPLVASVFEGLKELQEVIPPELMGDAYQNLFSDLKLNSTGLPYRRISEQRLAVVQPFMKEVEKVDTKIVKKIWISYSFLWGHFVLPWGYCYCWAGAQNWENCMR